MIPTSLAQSILKIVVIIYSNVYVVSLSIYFFKYYLNVTMCPYKSKFRNFLASLCDHQTSTLSAQNLALALAI